MTLAEQVLLHAYGDADKDVSARTSYPGSTEDLIHEALIDLVGDLPPESLWGLATFTTDAGNGIDLPVDHDFGIVLGGLWDNGENSGYCRRGNWGEWRLYEAAGEEPTWYVNPTNGKAYIRPYGGQLAIFQLDLADLTAGEGERLTAPQRAFRNVLLPLAAINVIQTQLSHDVENARFALNIETTSPELITLPDVPTLGTLPELPDKPPLPTAPTAPNAPSFSAIEIDKIAASREAYTDAEVPAALVLTEDDGSGNQVPFTFNDFAHAGEAPTFDFSTAPPSFGSLNKAIPAFSFSEAAPSFGTAPTLPSALDIPSISDSATLAEGTASTLAAQDPTDLLPSDIDTQLDKPSKSIKDHLNEDEIEMVRAEISRVQVLYAKAQLEQREYGTIPERTRVELQKAQQALTEKGGLIPRFQAMTQRLNLQIQGLRTEHDAALNRMRADLSSKDTQARFGLSRYRELLSKSTTEQQAALNEVRAQIDQVNAAFQGSLGEWRAKLESENVSTLRELAIFNATLQESITEFETSMGSFRTKLDRAETVFNTNAQRYRLDIDQRLRKLQIFQQALLRADERAQTVEIETARLNLQRQAREYEARLGLHRSAINAYVAEVQRWTSEYRLALEAYTAQYSTLIREFEAKTRTYGAQAQAEIANLQASIRKYQTDVEVAVRKVTADISSKEFRGKQLFFTIQRLVARYRRRKMAFLRLTYNSQPSIFATAGDFYA